MARSSSASLQRLVAGFTAFSTLVSAPLGGWLLPLPAAAQTPGSDGVATVQGAPVLPALGESVGRELSPAAERALGDRAMSEIWRDPDVIDDPVLLEYVQGIWSALLNSSRARGELTPDLDAAYAWQPFLIAEPEVNAFAMPGGYMGIYLGLIALTDTRDELASVLAHELSHITQRHIARMIQASPKFSALSIASMVLGALAASRNPQAGEAIMMGGQAAAASGELSFSRDMGREADRIGLSVLTGAGFSPVGMAHMFEKLEQASRLNDDNEFPFLRDHPLTTARIGEARERLGLAAFSATAPPDHVYALIQARASVLMDRRGAHLQQIADQGRALEHAHALAGELRQQAGASAASGAAPSEQRISLGLFSHEPEPLAQAYAVALAATLLRQWGTADHALALARAWLPELPADVQGAERRQFELLTLESMIARDDAAAAKAVLERLRGDDSRPVLMARARWALLGGSSEAEARDSASALEQWVSIHPKDSLGWSLLSRLWQRLGQPLRALRADAESHAAILDLAGAIDRLRAGQHLARQTPHADPIESAVIDTRLAQLESLQRQQAKDAPKSP